MKRLSIENCNPKAHPHVVDVWYSTRDEDLRRWLEHTRVSTRSVHRIGLDVEWRPNFVKGRVENAVALVQVGAVIVLSYQRHVVILIAFIE